jgi:glutamyl-Q tRNA(Asp) synthetase
LQLNDVNVLRFAPSPNGELHLGHALSALVGFSMARRLGGRFLLRIEDIDTARVREDFVTRIFEDLRWLGIAWDQPVRRQSNHLSDYQAAADRLQSLGVLYPCFATRAEILAAAAQRDAGLDPDGAPIYPGLHKSMDSEEVARRRQRGELFAMRLDLERATALVRSRLDGRELSFTEFDEEFRLRTEQAQPTRWGDVVIQRKDIPTSYHLSVVVDDALQNVTHVTRGSDLRPATDLHRLLQVLLDLPEPLYHHHRLVVDASGRKLSKSARDTSLRQLRAHGATPADVRRMIGLHSELSSTAND